MNFLPEIFNALINSSNALSPPEPYQSVPMASQNNLHPVDNQLAVERPVLSPPVPPSQNPLSSSSTPPGIVIPFQHFLHTYKGEEKFFSLPVLSIPGIADSIALGRVATLLEIEVLIFPNFKSSKYPSTVLAAWTPNYLTPTAANVCSVYGAQQITFGGSYHFGTFTVPCDLRMVNSVIKSPVSFTDNPRLSLFFPKNADAQGNTVSICDVFVRGKVEITYGNMFMGAAAQ